MNIGFHQDVSLQGLNARHKLLSKIEECLQQRKEEGSGFDALSLMMGIDGEEKLTLEELKDVGLELLFAGHATCASAASSLLLHLAKNKHVSAATTTATTNTTSPTTTATTATTTTTTSSLLLLLLLPLPYH